MLNIYFTGFLTKEKLLHHTVTVHEEKRPYKCSFCDEHFKTIDGVQIHSGKCVEHLKVSPKLGPGERACCTQCNKTYVTKSALRKHVEVFHLKIKCLEILYSFFEPHIDRFSEILRQIPKLQHKFPNYSLYLFLQ